ncbi:MAG TPA: hypothetical protein VMB77_10120, partial [Syntrophales bacterium]|nr:hypothetical protein [Syntrophales bacterium]
RNFRLFIESPRKATCLKISRSPNQGKAKRLYAFRSAADEDIFVWILATGMFRIIVLQKGGSP